MNDKTKEIAENAVQDLIPAKHPADNGETPQPLVYLPSNQPDYPGMISAAINKGLPIETLEKLMDLNERYEKNEARKQYFFALAGFAKDLPVVTKDKFNKQYGSNYASLENTSNTIARALAPFGLKHHWSVDQTSEIAVTCTLSHVAGHSEQSTISGPVDTSGAKNELQQIKSTITYLKLATLETITGTASAEGSTSDDGNTAEPIQTITERQAANLRDVIVALPGARENDEAKFCKFLKIETLEEMPAKMHSKAVKVLADQKREAGK